MKMKMKKVDNYVSNSNSLRTSQINHVKLSGNSNKGSTTTGLNQLSVVEDEDFDAQVMV
jgi:BMFP domain-containing protein YqiC